MSHKNYLYILERFNVYIFLLFTFLLPHSGLNSPVMKVYQLIFVYIIAIGFLYSIDILIRSKYDKYLTNLSLLSNLLVFTLIVSKINGLFKFELLELNDFLSVVLVVYIPLFMIKYFKFYKDIKKIYIILMILIILNIFDGIYQYIYGVDFVYSNPPLGARLTGMFSWGAPVLGSFLGFFFFVIFYFYEDNKIKLLLLFTVFFVMFILSGNRSMPLVSLLGFFIGAFYSGKNRKFYLKMNLSFIILLTIIFSLMFVYLSQILGDHISHRLVSLTGDIWEEQQTKRIATWIQTYYMILDNLFLGVGFGNYSYILENYLYIVPESEGSMPHPHQFHIDFIASGGILAFSILCLYMYNLYNSTIKLVANSKYKMINLMILFIIFSPLNVTHGLISLWWGVVLFTGIGLMYLNKRELQIIKG
jgi:hypothetical protein